jgi:hypothetical protein
MIKTEFLNDGTLIKHYSDAGFMLLQVETGIKYSDPVDVVPCRYTYEETDEKIDSDENATVGDGIHITGDEFLAKVEEVL